MVEERLGTSDSDLDEDEVCWVCLGAGTPDDELTKPCCCPRLCHAACIARWQLQSAGTRREKACEFCSEVLPDWRGILTPATGVNLQSACMNVNFFSKIYSFKVMPGPEGYQEFTAAIRKSFSLPQDSELNITFTCDDPSTGAMLTLQGPRAYDAAVYCAAISAARRAADGETGSRGTKLGRAVDAGSRRHHQASYISMDHMLQKAKSLASPIGHLGKRLRAVLAGMFP